MTIFSLKALLRRISPSIIIGAALILTSAAATANLTTQYWVSAVAVASTAALLLLIGILVAQIVRQRETAEALNQSRRTLETAQAVAHVGSWISELQDDQSLEWSAETFRIFGVDKASWRGTVGEFFALIHPEDQETVRRASRAAIENGLPYDVEHRICRPDGTVRWVRELAEIVRDAFGRPMRLVGTVQDITEQKYADEALRLSEARLRDYLDTASDGYWETDEEHRFTFATSRLRPAGYDFGKLLGMKRTDLADDLTSEPDKWAAHHAQLERREPFRDLVYRRVLVDGAVTYLSVSGKPVFDSSGRFTGYRGTTRDVTPRIEAEEKLREAKTAAETASAAKSAFLANMSHELRTPLNAVIGFAEVLNGKYFGALNDKQADYVKDIRASGHHLLLLINDVLDVAKIEAGRFKLDREPLVVGEEIDSCLRLVGPKAQEGRIRIETRQPDELVRYTADRRAFKQILLNLMSNAIKFTEPGGRVTVEVEGDSNGSLRIAVIDTGIGIAAQDLPRIVVPFGALARDAKLSRGQEGTGLGLALTKSLVEMHGGSLEITSRLGHGTVATVHLPPVSAAVAA